MRFRLFAVIVAACFALVGAAHAQGKIQLQWFAQSAFKLTTPAGKVVMIDPWLTGNPKCPPEWKDLDKLGKVDAILVTHGHGDHLGDSIALAKKNEAPVWGPAGMDQFLATLGFLPPKLAPRFGKGGTIEPVPGLKVTAVHAEHSSEMILKDPRPARRRAIPRASRWATSSSSTTGLRSITWATRRCSAT
jgi:L-ascorbate metabolism protein UlaG (beta-lactamase superfamily)